MRRCGRRTMPASGPTCIGPSRAMNRVDLLLALVWESETPAEGARHRDHFFAEAVDLERDRLPDALKKALGAARVGETVSVSFNDFFDSADETVQQLAREAFRGRRADGTSVTPKFGRFYPASHFDGLTVGTPVVRCVGINEDMLSLEPRHPLASHAVELTATIAGRLDASGAADRQPVDWMQLLSNGAGMQTCWKGEATDFLDDTAYARPDEGADPIFYGPPRITAHLDSRAQQVVGRFYQALIPSSGRVLDLMSSVHSNLARNQQYESLIGLGLNVQEMMANDRLNGAVICDLNAGAAIPFSDSLFDAAICTVSIDYLTDPVRTMAEVARVLKPSAPFAVTFSNRWFPPKVTRLWTELNSFEQMALVVSYFEQTGCFAEIETVSFRGYPRPMDDPYFRHMSEADPIFAIAGRVI